jgi:hypothetical protein
MEFGLDQFLLRYIVPENVCVLTTIRLSWHTSDTDDDSCIRIVEPYRHDLQSFWRRDRGHIYEALAIFRSRKYFVRQPANNRVYGANNRLAWPQSYEGFVNMAPDHNFLRLSSFHCIASHCTILSITITFVMYVQYCFQINAIDYFPTNEKYAAHYNSQFALILIHPIV